MASRGASVVTRIKTRIIKWISFLYKISFSLYYPISLNRYRSTPNNDSLEPWKRWQFSMRPQVQRRNGRALGRDPLAAVFRDTLTFDLCHVRLTPNDRIKGRGKGIPAAYSAIVRWFTPVLLSCQDFWQRCCLRSSSSSRYETTRP